MYFYKNIVYIGVKEPYVFSFEKNIIYKERIFDRMTYI
jgi:hypothetical protein